MLIYGLPLYVCNSCQVPNGASTFTRVVIIDMFCKLSVGRVSLLHNYDYKLSFRSFTPVPFSQARTLVASLYISSNLPQLTLAWNRPSLSRSATFPP